MASAEHAFTILNNLYQVFKNGQTLKIIFIFLELTFLKEFISWLFKFLFNSIHLDSTFAKRNQTLLTLTQFIEIIGYRCICDDGQNENIILFDFESQLDKNRLQTLIEVLWDTYPINKDLALNLLIKIDKKLFETYEFSYRNYYNIAIGLLSSRKPTDSMTSVYLMMFIRHKSTLNALIDTPPRTDTSLSIYLIKSIENEFAEHCSLAKNNLLMASLKKPIYGPLAALRNLINLSLNE